MQIPVEVPEARIAEFYSWYGKWLAGEAAAESDAVESAGLTDWSREDVNLAAGVWAQLTDSAKQLFEFLIDHPGERVSAATLAEHVGAKDGFAVAGTMSWPARHSYKVGRKFPIRWSEVPEGSVYWMEPVTADLFREVRGG